MVRRVTRSNWPEVSTEYVLDAPGGIAPPAPMKTSFTPGSCANADSAGPLFASSAIAATGCDATSPTLQRSAWFEWTTMSGGESGCEPAGVRFVTVTLQARSFLGELPAAGISSAAVA